ncbi:hypothetical protein QM480_12930 [Flectobacillus sp. DC10W]|uniref:Lipoprotein n=1 Tax=Flectobacillus longus TaxID=2984207 RepID=A0ABT6YNU8_9BACT|nr:hypothetical protein [Flectobacillus longus]MDI9865236.1 hypothetical protein [Flectobacillus longus]
MKKIAFLILFLASFAVLYSCNTIPDVVAPGPNNELPAATGKLDVSFTDPTLNANPEVLAGSGDNVTVTLLIKKSPDGGKPRVARVYVADKANYRGTTDQPLFEVKLKNVDEQTQTFEYTVSASTGVNYIHFDVQDNSGAISRKTLKISIGSEGQIASWNNIELGAQSNDLGSRFASSTGVVYKVCDIDSNIKFVDITYASTRTADEPQFLSNPERVLQGYSTTVPASNTDCGGSSTAGGNATYFQEAPVGIDFDAANNTTLQALSISSTKQSVLVKEGKIYAYSKGSGTKVKKGLIRVKSITKGTAAYAQGKVVFDVKIQK